MKVDEKLHCKDCDGFGACEYYNRRKGTSQICSEFQNQWQMVKELEEIKTDIKSKYEFNFNYSWRTVESILDDLDNRIKELKGENNE